VTPNDPHPLPHLDHALPVAVCGEPHWWGRTMTGVPPTGSGQSCSAPSPDGLGHTVPNAGMLTCIVCDRQFERAANDPLFDAVPYGGTLFYSSGHYGSTVFDPFDGTKLEIIVCDKCLVERQLRVALVFHAPGSARRFIWDEYASAIEARSDATGTGAAVGERAVGEAETPTPNPEQGGNHG
jgi:hypothetical protein